jgi:outer membrane receptor protein involved in Fe transport
MLLGLPAALTGVASAQVGGGDVLEEITVTAQRRNESIQTVPVAVTAIDPVQLERRQITDTKQVIYNVPNLTGNSNVGQATATAFFLRGVGTTENLATADTSVGLYVDDVYIARQAVNNFNLADIERIEVLRGPQGTLYGRNTNGGAIKIVTKKPSADPELAVRGSYGNYNRWSLRLSGNAPITDEVFVRANFLTQQGDGYIRNLTLGKDVNDLDYVGGRIAVRALPSENVDINFAFDYSKDVTNGNYASDIAGVYYFKETADIDLTDLTRSVANGPQSRFNKVYDIEIESYAGFAQLEYTLGDFTLLAAARYTSEDRSMDVVQTSSIPTALFNYTTADLRARAAAGQNITPDRSFSRTTPKFGVNWQINDELFAYASYTEGFRSGGWTGRALRVDQFINFAPETVETYELGLKTTLAGGKVRWNTSVFSMDYSDLFNTLTIAGVFTVQTADAKIEGAETEFTYRASRWLDLFANVGYLDTAYKGTRPVNLAPELQRAPQLQVKAGFSVDYPLAAGSLLVNADAFYTDKYLASPANLSFTVPLQPAGVGVTGDFTIVNASVGYRWNEDKYEVSASCTNCLDEEYFEGGTYIGSYAGVWTGAPRFYRLGFGIRM